MRWDSYGDSLLMFGERELSASTMPAVNGDVVIAVLLQIRIDSLGGLQLQSNRKFLSANRRA